MCFNCLSNKGGLNGTLEDEPFTYMRDVRKHGQDVLLTMTIDPKLTDDHIIAIAKDLRTFGRVQLRINHEATGDWFSFNKRASYEEVAAFFVHCCEIIHREAPNVKVIICLDGCKELEDEQMEKEDIFAEAARAADIVSVDRYMALHWGWPYDVAGAYDQAAMLKEFCEKLKEDKEQWLSGFTLYQMRDRGRLGLEIEDPNNANVGIEQPILETYREIIHEDFFSPVMEEKNEITLPAKLRWGGSEDADGIAIPLHFEKNPVFCEVYFEEDGLEELNLMMELNGHWFYKAPGVKCIDMMSAFFKKPLSSEADMTLKIFAPPATGENDSSQGDDWQTNYYTEMKALPKIRIRFAPIV